MKRCALCPSLSIVEVFMHNQACGARVTIRAPCALRLHATRVVMSAILKSQSRTIMDYVAQQQSDRGRSPEGQEDMPLFMIQTVKGKPETGITVEPEVNGVPLEIELDTGASVSIVLETTWKDRFAGVPAGENRYSVENLYRGGTTGAWADTGMCEVRKPRAPVAIAGRGG